MKQSAENTWKIQDVPMILAEDETRVKPRIRWEAKRDTLIGFCGNKENHVCEFGLELEMASNLADFDGLQSDIVIIEALKVGFSEAQDMLSIESWIQ
ncbi:hypothetical protein R1sor_023266 [Riccia sorocarpa]|uniref:Uncharacterized protein n=1 Tax=Riccia sorocarpa TaxID=122646 RepID=A0ABD3GM59_9MARC